MDESANQAPQLTTLANAMPDARVADSLAGGGEMGELIRSVDWSQTPVGPIENWSATLRSTIRFLLANRFPILLWWGPQYVQFYNDAYRPIPGTKHPQSLGQRAAECWPEIWHILQPLVDTPFNGGPATWMEDILLVLNRRGFLEETHFTIAYSPVPDEAAPRGIGGVIATVHEITGKVVGERRVRILSELGARDPATRTAEDACGVAAETLARHPGDIPFALLYLIDDNRRCARLAGASGIAPGETASPIAIDLDGDAEWPIDDVIRSNTMIVVEDLGRRFRRLPSGPWPDPPGQAVLAPIRSPQLDMPAGVLVAGVSARLELDELYSSFYELVAAQIATTVANARAYEEERRRAEALAQIDRAKTAFFSNISHEFRTPLTLMLGPLDETIADPQLPAGTRERLQLVERNALRMQKLVNSLLDFSRIEAGRMQASYEETDLAQLTRDIASTFRSAMEKAGLGYDVECDELDEDLFVDREMWEKIVLNLLSNAFKFTLSGAVVVRLGRIDGHAMLEVVDTGVGIPEEELPRLFERFHRVESTQGRTHEGSGIGLALVHELVKLHGGTIEARSTVGAGTTIRVLMPFGTAHLPSDRLLAPRTQSGAVIGARHFVQEALRWLQVPDENAGALRVAADNVAPARDRRFASTFGSRILLADDNADMRVYLRDLLSPYYAVEAVADGEQALSAAQRKPPDLILSDIMMPRIDGFGLLREIRGDEKLRSVPVVLLSARAGEEARIEGLDAGADDYIIKPFSARELLARVGALLELRAMRRETEEAFRRRTAQYETLLTAAPLGVYLIDADFRIREVNPTAQALFGDVNGLIGSDFDDVLHRLWPQAYADEIASLFRHTLTSGEPYFTAERAGQRRDRKDTEYYEWQISRIPLPDGTHGVVCYFRDVSSHVLAREQLRLADRQKDEFLAMLSHELRNPLAPIRNAGEVLARTRSENPNARAATDIVRRQVEILTRLVDDLLDVSRVTQGRIELKRQPVELADVIAQALEIVDPLIKERQHTVSITTYGKLRVNGDLARLVQCVTNILTNAAKYTDPNGNIGITYRAHGPNAVLTVSDTGIGMRSELLPRVFDLFVQSDRTLDRAQGGLGIGLAIVKRLIEMHGGTVSARSAGLGLGSTFEIRLPLITAAVPASTAQAVLRVPPRRILVVDDNEDASTALAMMLRLEGHEVRSFPSGAEALAHMAEFEVDVALLDIGLPGMNGYELARRLRECAGARAIRLVALTGYGQAEDRERARAVGFDEHLVKPADLRSLQQVLARSIP
jgi:PAS domain S-box-containing protein